MRISGLLRNTWIPDGSETDSSSRSDGRASPRSTTLGKMPRTSIPTPDLVSYKKEMMISTWRRTFIVDIPTPLSELTLLPLAHDLPDEGESVNSQRGR